MESLKKFLFIRLAGFIFGMTLVEMFWPGESHFGCLAGKAVALVAWTVWMYFALTRLTWVAKVK